MGDGGTLLAASVQGKGGRGPSAVRLSFGLSIGKK